MIYGNVELHNVAEVQPVDGGVLLLRVPESVRAQINKEAQMRVRQTDNCEIRFVAGKGPVEVTLSSDGEVYMVLRDVVRESPHPNVHVVEGTDLLTKWDGLGADLLHPSDNAMIEMGRNLSAKLGAILGRNC